MKLIKVSKLWQVEKAIEIYEHALKKNPKNGLLIRRVGQALIKTHYFERVSNF